MTPSPSVSEAKASHNLHQVALPFVCNTPPACKFWGSDITNMRVYTNPDRVFSSMLRLLALSTQAC